jgi:hypothetical protein
VLSFIGCIVAKINYGWPLILICSEDREFYLILEKESRSRDAPSLEGMNGLVELVSNSIQHISRTRITIDKSREWTKASLPPRTG